MTPDAITTALVASGCLPCQLAKEQGVGQYADAGEAPSLPGASSGADAPAARQPELAASPGDAGVSGAAAGASWSGPIGFEGVPTGDGRFIEPGALRWDTLPLPLRWVASDVGGHDGAEVVGLITSIERIDGGAIFARGTFDLGSPVGREAARQVGAGLTTGTSMDLDDASFDIRVAADVLDPPAPEDLPEPGADGMITVVSLDATDEMMVTTSARIRSATLVAIPAFEGARIALADAPASPPADTPADAPAIAEGDRVGWGDDLTGTVEAISDDGVTATVQPDDEGADPVDVPVADLTPLPAEEPPADMPMMPMRVLAASAAPLAPPTAWFADPGLSGPTPFTITDNGRVYGHLALWGTCHLSHAARGACVTPPANDSGYRGFHLGALRTAEGTDIAVGVLMSGTDHAGLQLAVADATAHYDHTGRAVADVRVGQDASGIWVAGALRPDVTPEQVRALRAATLSGDWRQSGLDVELVAILAVNVPGFPIPRQQGHVKEGRVTSLVASGMLLPSAAHQPPLPAGLTAEDVAWLRAARSREVATAATALAARVRRSRIDAFAATLRRTRKD